ncbi:MAG: ABC transporter permease subunit [Candidatus Thermoplasmatota archaeon]
MKFGQTMLIELKNRWKGYLIFLLVLVILIGGLISAFPSFSGAYDDKLEGAENIEVKVIEEDGNVTVELSWADWAEEKEPENYTLLVGKSPNMMVPDRREGINASHYEYFLQVEDEEEEELERYFAVVAVFPEREDEFVGMRTNVERRSVMDEVRDLYGADIADIRGYISMLWSTWFVLIIGLYIGYISANSVSKDHDEEGRMDVLFSNPISRRQYILEKFSIVSIYTFFLLAIVGLVMIASADYIGELGTVSSSALLLSALLSWPMFLVIIAISLLAAVYFENSKKAVGASFLFILIQYGIQVVGDMGEKVDYVKPYTIISYWDYEGLLYGETISMIDIGFLFVLVVLLVIVSVKIFERKDIPIR